MDFTIYLVLSQNTSCQNVFKWIVFFLFVVWVFLTFFLKLHFFSFQLTQLILIIATSLKAYFAWNTFMTLYYEVLVKKIEILKPVVFSHTVLNYFWHNIPHKVASLWISLNLGSTHRKYFGNLKELCNFLKFFFPLVLKENMIKNRRGPHKSYMYVH